MYRCTNKIVLHINNTYKKITFKCFARTGICMTMEPVYACSYAASAGGAFILMKLRAINQLYDIRLSSVKYAYTNKYKFKNVVVPDCTATGTFEILYAGKPIGHILSVGIIIKLIRDNNNQETFEFQDTNAVESYCL
jgi:hypothetical protein